LPTAERRVLVLLEAAHAAMAEADERADARRARLDEAIAYLGEARQRPPTIWAGDVLLGLALALDRAGDRAASDVVLADAHRGKRAPRADAARYLASADDALALAALAAEGDDRPGALKTWEAWLASPAARGAWAAPARARLRSLDKAAPAPAPKGRRR
jgi:hypothetical protein